MTELPNEVWQKMNKEERYTELMNSMSGYMPNYPKGPVVMGSEAMNRYYDFIKQMIKKYEIHE